MTKSKTFSASSIHGHVSQGFDVWAFKTLNVKYIVRSVGYIISLMVGPKKQDFCPINQHIQKSLNCHMKLPTTLLKCFVLKMLCYKTKHLRSAVWNKFYLYSKKTRSSFEYMDFWPKILLCRTHHQDNYITKLALIHSTYVICIHIY